MSLLKAIEHNKEHRQPRRAKWITQYGLYTDDCFWHSPKVCQCPRCRDDRLFNNKKREVASMIELRDNEERISSSEARKLRVV